MLTVLVLLSAVSQLPNVVHTQFVSLKALGARVPGKCSPGYFECGGGRCIPIRNWHDGKPDCPDGSDEWCLPGFIKCGTYCADIKYTIGCLFNARCDGRVTQPAFCELSKQKLCLEPYSFPCKAYGECALWNWVRDGKNDCLDESDERDAEYIAIMERGYEGYMAQAGGSLSSIQQSKQINQEEYPNGLGEVVSAPVIPNSGPAPPLIPDRWSTPHYPFYPIPTVPHTAQEHYPNENPFGGEYYNATHSKPTPSTSTSTSIVQTSKPDTPDSPFLNSSKPPPPESSVVHIDINKGASIIHRPPTIKSRNETTTEYSATPKPSFPGHRIGSGTEPIVPVPEPGDYDGQSGYVEHPSPPPQSPFSGVEGATRADSIATTKNEVQIKQTGHFTTRPPVETEKIPLSPNENLPFGAIPPMIAPTGSRPWIAPPVSLTPAPRRPAFKELVVPTGFLVPVPAPAPVQIRPVTPRILPTQPSFPVSNYPHTGNEASLPSSGNIPSIVHPTLIAFNESISAAPPSIIPKTPTERPTVWQPIQPINPLLPPPILPGTGTFPPIPTTISSKSPPITKATTEKPTTVTTTDEEELTTTTEYKTSTTTEKVTTARTSETEGTIANPCAHKLKQAAANAPSKRCDCEIGLMRVDRLCKDVEVSSFTVAMPKICGTDDFSDEEIGSIAAMKLSTSISYPFCIRLSSDGHVLVGVDCQGCDIEQIREQLKNFDDDKPLDDVDNPEIALLRKVPLNAAALGSTICEDDTLNTCHHYALCKPSRLTYTCRCKPGTNDTSGGTGRICEGIPEEDDCVIVFGVCMIFWCLLLLGLLFLLPLLGWCCLRITKQLGLWQRGRNRIAPRIAFENKPTVINIEEDFRTTNTARFLQQAFGKRAEGMKFTGQALQNLSLPGKSILKTSESGASLVVESIEKDANGQGRNTSPDRVSQPMTIDVPQSLKKLDFADSVSNETPILDNGSLGGRKPDPIRMPSPKKAEIAHSPTPPTAIGTPEQSRLGSAATAISAKMPSEVHSTPSSPVVSMKVPQGSVTAPVTPATGTPPVIGVAGPLAAAAIAAASSELNQPDTAREKAPSPQPSIVSKQSRAGGAPTIWETYRVLGDQYSRPETARPDTSDSLEKLMKDRFPSPPQPAEIVEALKTKIEDVPQAEVPVENIPGSEEYNENPPKCDNQIEMPAEALVTQEELTSDLSPPPSPGIHNAGAQPDNSAKLAEMLGVTLDSGAEPSFSHPEPSDREERRQKLEEADQAAILELAKRGLEIDVPEDLDYVDIYKKAKTTDDVKPTRLPPKVPLPRKISDLSPAGRVKKGPSFTRKIPVIKKDDGKPPKQSPFIPKGTKLRKDSSGDSKAPSRIPVAKTPSTIAKDSASDVDIPNNTKTHKKSQLLRPPKGDADLSTGEDSDLDISIHRFEAAVKKKKDAIGEDSSSSDLDVPRSRRHKRKRKPERQLSSISEKSADIAAEVLFPTDYIMSAPTTTRDISDFRPQLPGRKTRRRTDKHGEDVDIPEYRRRPLKKYSDDPGVPMEMPVAVSSRNKSRLDIRAEMEATSDVDIPREASVDSSFSMKGRPTAVDEDMSPVSSRQRPRTISKSSVKDDDNVEFFPSTSQKPDSSRSTKSTTKKTKDRVSALKKTSHQSRFHSEQVDQNEDVNQDHGRSSKFPRPTMSRSSERQSTIGRKIASRRHQQHHHHAGFLSARVSSTTTKSCGNLCDECHHESDSSGFWMPGIKSRRNFGFYSARASPAPFHRHGLARSLTSLHGSKGSELEMSPYFDPVTDFKKPHKEGLWWGHPHL